MLKDAKFKLLFQITNSKPCVAAPVVASSISSSSEPTWSVTWWCAEGKMSYWWQWWLKSSRFQHDFPFFARFFHPFQLGTTNVILYCVFQKNYQSNGNGNNASKWMFYAEIFFKMASKKVKFSFFYSEKTFFVFF